MVGYLWKNYGRQVVLAGVLLVQMFVLGRMSPSFLESQNLLDMATHMAEAGIIAVGMTFIIMTGGIDLSVGSVLALCGITFGYLMEPLGVWPAAGVALFAGFLAGSFNGALVALGRLPALVVTLGTMALFRGIAMVISKGQPASDFPEEFSFLGWGIVGGVPVQLWIWLALVVVGMVVVDRSRIGRYVIAVGDNVTAARYAALPERTVTLLLYSFTGLFAAMAGLILAARVSTAKADAAMGLELDVITAVVLGGTAITGGRGTVLGTFLGVLILGFLRTGLSFAEVPTIYQTMLAGGLLIVVSVINQWLLERSGRPRRRRKIVAEA